VLPVLWFKEREVFTVIRKQVGITYVYRMFVGYEIYRSLNNPQISTIYLFI